MWDLPGPGLEPVPPELADGFLTTAPPGKPSPLFLNALNEWEIDKKISVEFLGRLGGEGAPEF